MKPELRAGQISILMEWGGDRIACTRNDVGKAGTILCIGVGFGLVVVELDGERIGVGFEVVVVE